MDVAALQRPAAVRTTTRALALPVTAVVVFVLTAALRLVGGGRSSDLFVDELIYRYVSRNTADGGFPSTNEGLFFLHPPGFFYLQAAWGNFMGSGTDVVADVYAVRSLNALLAGGTAVLIVLLVHRVRSLPPALLAGVVFALDPYVLRQNNRAMLETETMLWVLAGFLVLLPLARGDTPERARGRAVCAGLLFGMAVLTKDHAALITVLPLLFAVFLRWGPPRRLLLHSLAAAVVPYACYVLAVAAAGHIEPFWAAKTSGVSRLLGFEQTTGFNSEGTPGLTARLAEEMADYGSTYALLAVGVFALVVLLRSQDPAHRLLGLFQASAFLTLAYAVALGTLEEQALYLLFVPTLVALAVALPQPLGDGVRRLAPRWRTATAAGLVVVLGLSTASYVQSRTTPDDGYAQLRAYMAQQVPRGTAVTAADGGIARGMTEWALQDRYDVGTWTSPTELAEADVRYAVVAWKLVDEGYGRLTEREARALVAPADQVFAVHGETYGKLTLYRLPPTGGSA